MKYLDPIAVAHIAAFKDCILINYGNPGRSGTYRYLITSIKYTIQCWKIFDKSYLFLRIFFVLLLVFGFSIALLILTKFKPNTDLLSDDAFYMAGMSDRRMMLQNNLARRYRVSQGASALMQSLNNMAASGNNRRINRSSYQHLLNFWTRQIPTNAWNRLPSTT